MAEQASAAASSLPIRDPPPPPAPPPLPPPPAVILRSATSAVAVAAAAAGLLALWLEETPAVGGVTSSSSRLLSAAGACASGRVAAAVPSAAASCQLRNHASAAEVALAEEIAEEDVYEVKGIKVVGRPLYLDMQATTPVDPRVLDAMLPYYIDLYGNPHSRTHLYGWESEDAIERARQQVAKLINADPKEIIFTSGATESNNMAIKGVAHFYQDKKKHIITTQTDHKCVLDSCRQLQQEGFDVTYLPALINGGGQERGLRSGTLPTPLVVGFGAAAEVALQEMERDRQHAERLSKRLYDGITSRIASVVLNGDAERRYPGNLNLSFAHVEGESLLMGLKQMAVSSGSACTSASLEPSYVLRALGVAEDMAHTSIRFGIGRFTTEAEIEYAIETTVEQVEKLRAMSPLWEMRWAESLSPSRGGGNCEHKEKLESQKTTIYKDISRALMLVSHSGGTATGLPAPSRAQLRVSRAALPKPHQTPTPPPASLRREAGPLEVLYEDDCLLAVNKPAGIRHSPRHHYEGGALVNFVVRDGDDAGYLSNTPYTLHRLDMYTSGVVCFAKTKPAATAIATQFRRHQRPRHQTQSGGVCAVRGVVAKLNTGGACEYVLKVGRVPKPVQKHYFALVVGTPPHGFILDAPIGRNPGHPIARQVLSSSGKSAVTHFECVLSNPKESAALLRATPLTGRTHQIRVHLLHSGYPIVQDELYGAVPISCGVVNPQRTVIQHQALHAAVLQFAHPESHETMCFRAPLPLDFRLTMAAFDMPVDEWGTPIPEPRVVEEMW
eukprot:jgi/Chlat1/2851/Chrsp194S00793